jgi:hypothetical protein
VVPLGVVSLLEHVASARQHAKAENWTLLAHLVREDEGKKGHWWHPGTLLLNSVHAARA